MRSIESYIFYQKAMPTTKHLPLLPWCLCLCLSLPICGVKVHCAFEMATLWPRKQEPTLTVGRLDLSLLFATRYNILQYFTIFYNILQHFTIFYDILQYFTIFLTLLQYFTIFSTLLQYFTIYISYTIGLLDLSLLFATPVCFFSTEEGQLEFFLLNLLF